MKYIEFELTKVTDATTGKLLIAGVDRRIADKSLKTAMDTWAAVSNVTAIWSKLLRYRLCKERGATNCVWPLSKSDGDRTQP